MKNLVAYLFPDRIRWFVKRVLVGMYLFLRKRSKIVVRTNSSDIDVVYHTFIRNMFSTPYPMKSPKVIIDAGANIGATSLLFAEKFPSAKVLAIEPETSNYNILVDNTAHNKNITTLKCGVWSSDKKLKIENPLGEKWSFQTVEVDDNEKFDIEGVSIHRLMEEHNLPYIDIFKIDIEGAEKELFSKNEQVWLENTDWIIIEIHGESCRSTVEKAMENYHFQYRFTNGENLFYQRDKVCV